ncbi:unnamed protein product, partial [Lymnaea stagnalis]
KESGAKCSSHTNPSLDLDLIESRWHRPLDLQQLGTLLSANKNVKTRLLFGNTSTGIFKNEGPYDLYIDLHGVKELYQFT